MRDSGEPEVRARDGRQRLLPGVIVVLATVAVIAGWAGGLQLFAAGGDQRSDEPPARVTAAPSIPDNESPSAPAPRASMSPGAPPSSGASASAAASPGLLDPVFGMSGHLMWHDVATAVRQLDMVTQDGLGVIRFDVSWRNSEPAKGSYQYLDKLDQIVDAANQRGLKVVITIVETPGWANGGQSLWVPPDDPADYAAFAGMLAARYAGRVLAWEVWNEPDTRLFWLPNPDPVAYTKLLLAASASIRQADPGAMVIGGSITFGNTGFVKAMYANGAKGSFDALSVHPYTLTHAPGDESDRFHSLTAILDDVHALMDKQGDGGTPIWVTEFGWASVGLNSVSPDLRVKYMAATVPLIRQRPWVTVLTMYTIDTQDSERYGLSTNGDRSAAWKAYVAAVHANAP
jgi:polysaccharide biosynthesis protein PslG